MGACEIRLARLAVAVEHNVLHAAHIRMGEGHARLFFPKYSADI